MTKLRNSWNFQMVRMGLSFVLVGMTSLLVATPTSSAGPIPVSMLAAAATAQGDFGTIKGKLVWGGAQIPAPIIEQAKGKATKDPEVCAKNAPILSQDLVIDPKTKGIANGFAYLVRPKGTNPTLLAELLKANPSVEVDQKDCEFLPHSTAINKGQTLIFKSSDPTSHNVRYSSFNNNAFNQNVPPNTKVTRNLVADRLPIPVNCDIHPWMKANVMVFDHPFFAVTKVDGSFEIKGVPAGAQKFVLWQEKIGYVTPNKGVGIAIDVKPGQVLDLGDIPMGK